SLALAVAIPATISAQSLVVINDDFGIQNYGGLQGLAISENGKWLCGTTQAYAGFLLNMETAEVIYDEPIDDYGCELRGVSNAGNAIGMNGNAISIDATGYKFGLETPGLEQSIANDITPDGSLIVGFTYNEGYRETPVIWEANGALCHLPVTTTEEIGFEVNGCRCCKVSEDGSVIVGYLVDNFATYPVVFWIRQDNGSYALDTTIAQNFFEPGDGDKPYLVISPSAISKNGRYVALQLMVNDGSYTYYNGVYDLQTHELHKATVLGDFEGAAYYPSAISNNGDVVGMVIYGWNQRIPYVYSIGNEYGTTFADTFTSDEFSDFISADIAIPTNITGDGRYVIGWSVDYETYAYYTFMIDFSTGAVSKIAVDPSAAEEVARYDVSGKIISKNTPGINIIRMSDGSAQKVLVK
ncbi:MAG: hypothetical protein ACI30S_08025, partial [Muribaculaceae bacterium]